MALGAITAGGESIVAVMAGPARFALFHVSHREVSCARLVGEDAGMAIVAAIHGKVCLVAEDSIGNSFYLESDFLGFHTLMAFPAIAGNGKGRFVVMARAAGPSFFHLRHGNTTVISAGQHFAIMAALAFASCRLVMGPMAELCLGCAFHLVYDWPRFPCMAKHAFLLIGNTECLDSGMATAARFRLLHLRHGILALIPQVENGIVTNSAVVVIFLEVRLVTENYRIGMGKSKGDVFGFTRSGC